MDKLINKFDINEIPRFNEILEGRTPSQWLTDKGFKHYPSLGWVKQNRLEYCIEKGYVRRGGGGDLFLTELGCSLNFLKYMWGDENAITRKTPAQGEGNKPKWEAKKPVKTSVQAEMIFKDMLE